MISGVTPRHVTWSGAIIHLVSGSTSGVVAVPGGSHSKKGVKGLDEGVHPDPGYGFADRTDQVEVDHPGTRMIAVRVA